MIDLDTSRQTSPPLVTVVIAVFNGEKYIKECIGSVLNQTYPNVETIIVDDGSTDSTESIVRQFGSAVTYRRQRNSGAAASPRNEGIAISSGEYLAFLDYDDVLERHRIASHVKFMQDHPNIDLAFGDYRNFDDGGDYSITHFSTCPALSKNIHGKECLIIDDARPDLARENFGITGTFTIRRRLLELEPWFDISLRASEDFDFYYRLSKHTPVGVINDVILRRRLHSTNLSEEVLRQVPEGIKCYMKLAENEQNRPAMKYLKQYAANYWLDWSRFSANNSRFMLSLLQLSRGFYTDPSVSRLLLCMKLGARSAGIRIGMHTPDEV